MKTAVKLGCFYCTEVEQNKDPSTPSDLHPVRVRLVYESEVGVRSDKVKGYKGPFDAYFCSRHFNDGAPVQPPLHLLIAPGSTCVECKVWSADKPESPPST